MCFSGFNGHVGMYIYGFHVALVWYGVGQRNFEERMLPLLP